MISLGMIIRAPTGLYTEEWSGANYPPPDYPQMRESPPASELPITGRCDNLLLRPGLLLMIRDLVTLEDISGEKETGPAIHVGLMMEGAGSSWIRGSNRHFDFQPGQMSLMTTNRPVRGAFHLPAGSHLRLIDIRFELAFLGAILRDTPLLTDNDILSEEILNGHGVQLAYLPMNAAVKQIAGQIFGNGIATPSERLFLEGKAIEVLSLALDLLGERRRAEAGPRTEVPLSGRDRQRLHAARDRLVADLENPPSIAALARLIGLNENKLKQGFRKLFGNSVYAFLQEHRMRTAAGLLEQGGTSVTAVALAVGYANPAHFAKIFRRYYGAAPSRYGRVHDFDNESQLTPDHPLP